jgi:hypothetical protein
MSDDLVTTEDLKATARAEAKRRHSFLEQLRSNWALIGGMLAAATAVWNSYDGLRREVAKSTEQIARISSTVQTLSVSERTASERVIILEVGVRDLDRRTQTIESWLRQTAPTPAGRRLDMPSPPTKE